MWFMYENILTSPMSSRLSIQTVEKWTYQSQFSVKFDQAAKQDNATYCAHIPEKWMIFQVCLKDSSGKCISSDPSYPTQLWGSKNPQGPSTYGIG